MELEKLKKNLKEAYIKKHPHIEKTFTKTFLKFLPETAETALKLLKLLGLQGIKKQKKKEKK